MSPDAKLRMDVYQEGQRAFNAGAACPYTDWRARTWAKGRAAAEARHATYLETKPVRWTPPMPQVEMIDEFGPVWSDGVRRTREEAQALVEDLYASAQ